MKIGKKENSSGFNLTKLNKKKFRTGLTSTSRSEDLDISCAIGEFGMMRVGVGMDFSTVSKLVKASVALID
ncbi:MAG: hypothetical protein LBJ94_03430 [Puniceicoccales bacterium]|jgi:hypothetical protein|nr:hypothetical protein [Puniceicoccales bacterium]